MWRQVQRSRFLAGLPQELIVSGAAGFIQSDLADVNLVLELKIALLRANPHRAGASRQALHHAFEKLAMVFGRRKIALGEPGDLIEQLVDLLASFLDQAEIDLRLNAHDLVPK